MASTYSDSLKLELMATGANAATWGTNTNTNLEVLDAFAQGYVSKSVAGSADVTLTTGNADPDAESANKVIELTGALTGAISVLIPAVTGGSEYLIYNNTSGAYALTIAATGHVANGVVVTQGAYSRVYCDGTANFNVAVSTSLLGAVTTKGAAVFDAGATVTAGQDLTAGSGGINLYSNGVATATTFSGSGASLTNLPAANLAGTIANISGANLTALNASNVASGTLASDRLPTVPTTKGGTGLTALGTAGQVLTVTAPGTAVAYESISAGGSYTMTVFTSSGTWTKPAGLADVKIRVLGGGGGAGWAASAPTSGHFSGTGGGGGYAEEYLDAPAIGATETVTVGPGGAGGLGVYGSNTVVPGSAGGTSSFGAFVSSSGGAGGGGMVNGSYAGGGAGGIGTGGQFNYGGQAGRALNDGGGYSGSTPMAFKVSTGLHLNGNIAGSNSGNGATGRENLATHIGTPRGAEGSAGIVIVEEFS